MSDQRYPLAISAVMLFIVMMFSTRSCYAEPIVINRSFDVDGQTITIDASVFSPVSDNCTAYVIQPRTFDPDQLCALNSFAACGMYTVHSIVEDDSVEITFADGSILYYAPGGYIDYRTANCLDSWIYPYDFLVNELTPQGTIDGFAIEDALQMAQSLLLDLEIDQYCLVDSLAISRFMLENSLLPPQRSISDDDEGYYIKLNICLDSIQYMPQRRYSAYHGYEVSGSGVEMIVTRQGIQYFSITPGNVLYEVIAPVNGPQPICSLDEAICMLIQKYQQIIMIEPLQINFIELCYVVEPLISDGIQQYIAKPAWVFYSKPYDETIKAYVEADPLLIVDALSLVEIN